MSQQPTQASSVVTLIDMVLKTIMSESGRNLLLSILPSIVGENLPDDAIKKLCISQQIPLLRIVTALALGIDPLIGREEFVTSCSYAQLNDVMELHFTTDGGEDLCIGIYVSGSIRVATACKPMQSRVAEEKESMVSIKIGT